MSTAPAWRQEVNRRLAEHKNRKASASSSAVPAQSGSPEDNLGSSRAAQAAARVAARYSKAPSYSQMQAEEARIAVRAAEIATRVALEAQSTAEFALAGLHAASLPYAAAELISFPVEFPIEAAPAESSQPTTGVSAPPIAAVPVAEPEWDWTAVHQITAEPSAVTTASEPLPVPVAEPLAPEPAMEVEVAQPEIPAGPVTRAKDSTGQLLQIRWQPDMTFRAAETPAAEPFELSAEDWFTSADTSRHSDEPVQIEAHAIHANLIQFPRELIATRRMRPRLAEGPLADSETGSQLSIFEVDPHSVQSDPVESGPIQSGPEQSGSIQTETPAPVQHSVHEEPVLSPVPAASAARSAALSTVPSVSWATAEWPGMKLDPQAVAAPSVAEAKNKLVLAPLSRRLLAGVVDFALVGALVTFTWLTLALGMAQPLVPRMAEILGAGLFAITGLVYHAFFNLLSLRTPGMRYAGLSLCTLNDSIPTPRQLRRRLGAMVLSMIPLGLGLVWSIFDEDHLNWHDRFSQTYLRHS